MDRSKNRDLGTSRLVLGFLIAVCFSQSVVQSLEPHLCKKTVPDKCEGWQCESNLPIACYHGTCNNETGECQCSHCWTGIQCDRLENNNVPVFLEKVVEVEMDINSGDDVVATVLARDLDALKCPDDDECACARVNYFIDSGNNQSLFMIHPHSGVISLAPGKLLQEGLKHALTIGARNAVPHRKGRSISFEETPGVSKTTILVSAVSNDETAHSRRKRSSVGLPDSATFEIEKYGDFETDASVMVGTKVPMGLVIWLPAITTNITAELLTDKNGTALMTLCDVRITHVGSNFPDLEVDDVIITMEAEAGDYRYDRAVIQFGEVVNQATDTSDEETSKIKIEFYAIMQHVENVTDGDRIFVSGAVEYDDEVWGGQIPFTFVQEDWVKQAAVVTAGGASELSKLSAEIFNFTMELSDPANDVRVDVFTPYNTSDAFSVCRVRVADKGSSFGCLPDELPQVSYENATGVNSIASMDFGTITNAGARIDTTTSEDNTISGQFVVVLTNNTEVVAGEKYWLGVSLVIDDSEIYSSQIAVTANQIAPPTMVTSPEISFYAIDSNEVVIGGSVGFIVSVTLQESVTTALVIDMSMPYSDGTPVLSICSAKVLSVGYNMPCVGDAIMDYYQEDGSKTDYVQFNFGHVANVGERHLDGDNTIVVHVTAKLEPDHPAIQMNSTFLVTAGVRYEMADDDVLWIAQNPINVTDDAHDYVGDKVPTFQIINRADDIYIYNRSAASFEFEMFIPAATTFEPLTVYISMPVVEHRSLMSVCRVELVHFGQNFACYDTGAINIRYFSTQNDDLNDQVRIQFGIVSNPELEDTEENREGSKIRFEIHVNLEEHVKLVDGMEIWSSIDVTISETSSWTGQILLVANFTRPDLYLGETEPEYDFYRESRRGRKLKAGGTAIYYVSMMTSEQTVTGYSLNVTAPNETLSVCRVHLVEAGRNIPCLDLEREASYLSYDEDSHFDAAVLDLGPLRNTGLPPTANDDDNLMVAQVVVQMRPAALPPDNITLPDDQYFSVAMKTGTQDVWTADDYLEVNVEPPDLNFTVLPEFTLEKLTSETTVMIRGAAVFNLDMYIPYATIADYQVSFFSDVTQAHKMQVCDVQIVSSGWNIPCVNGSHVNTMYEASYEDEHYDAAYTDVVTLNNMNLYGTLQDDVNKVRVQVVAQLANNETIEDGDEFWVGASVSVNDGNMWLLQTPFTATENIISDEVQGDPIFDLIPPYENVTMMIGTEETFMLNITIPPMSTPFVINVSMPYIGDEALLSISKMELVYVGKNFACSPFWKLEPEYISDTQTSQNTTAIIDFGIIMNHGTSYYYQYGDYQYGDDDFHITLTVQLTDHAENTNHSIVPFNVSFHYSQDRVVTLNESVEVLVLGDEEPELLFNLTVAAYDPAEVNQGDVLDIYGMIQHSNTSSSHAHSVRINFMIPDYLEFSEVMEFEGPEPCITTGVFGLQFHFDELFFTDYYWFHFNLTMDPLRTIEIGSNFVNTTVPIDAIYYIRQGVDSDGNVELGDLYQTPTEVVDIVFNVAECYDVIGMGTLDPCQFTASSYSDDHTPSEAVLYTGTGWGSAVRDMAPYKGNDYIQVLFDDIYRVSGITIQWGDAEALYVTKHRMEYSNEGLIWHDYQEDGTNVEFVNAYNESYLDPWVLHILSEPFEAQYVRIIPTEYEPVINNTKHYPIMRFELLGCIKTRITSETGLCQTTSFPDWGHYERGFIVDPVDGSVFVCILEYIDGPMRCSFSRDKGESWHDMDTNVGNILALIPDTREIYGIAQSKIAVMRSDDLGETWYSIPVDNYLDYVDNPPSNMVRVEEVPFAYIADYPEPTFNDSSTVDEFYQWGAAKDGIYKRELVVETTTGLDNSTFSTSSWSQWTLTGEWTYPVS